MSAFHTRSPARRLILAAATSLVALLALTGSAQAAPADFDPSFGSGGTVFTPFGLDYDSANDVAIQADGKIVVAIRSDDVSFNSTWSVARYNADGSLDPTFSGDGKQTTTVGFNAYAQTIALQNDGKIVVGGSSQPTLGGNWDFAVVRYLENGTPDPGFGTGGVKITAISTTNGTDFGNSVKIQADGKIVLAGESEFGSQRRFSAIRYLDNGSLDSGFSGDGKQDTAIGAGSSFGRSMEIQADGKVVIAGISQSVTATQFTAIRYTTGGTLDPTYGGGDGIVVLQQGDDSQFDSGTTLQPDGKLVIGGSSTQVGTDDDFVLARVNTDGTPDPSFGTNGFATTVMGTDTDDVQDVVSQPNGKLVAVGYTYVAGIARWGIARYTANGVLDTSFEGDGILISGFAGGDEVAGAVAVQSDGKLVIAGNAQPNGLNKDVALLRLLGVDDPPPPAVPPTALSASIAKSLIGKIKAKKLKSISGTALGTGLAKVQISLARTDKKLLKKSKKCLFIKNSKGATKKVKAKKKKCVPSNWLTVKGTSSWSYKLKGKLKPGSYTLYVRALDAGGATQAKFSTKLGNQRSFKITK